MEMFFRKIEYFIEGSAAEQKLLAKGAVDRKEDL